MSKSTISTFQLFEMFPDQETARVYLESRLWPNGPRCPVCGLGERVTARKDGFYRCNQCKEDFTVRTGTIFERSHVPLHKWIYAMYLLVTARKGISSMQLAKEIGITQKSAWFILHRLREACGSKLERLQGIVEIDETYVGGKEKQARVQEAQGWTRHGWQDAGSWHARARRSDGRHANQGHGQGNDPSRDSSARRNRIDPAYRRSGAYSGIERCRFYPRYRQSQRWRIRPRRRDDQRDRKRFRGSRSAA